VIDDINGRLGFASTRGHTFSIWTSKNQNSSVSALESFFGIGLSMISPLGLSHADSDVMIAPPYVLADSLSYHAKPSKGMVNRDAYDAVQDKGYELVVLNLGAEGAYKPLNSLVLSNGGRPFVIANSMTPNFLHELDNLGVAFETVTADRSPLVYNGSIRCRTNYLSNAFLLECHGYKLYDA
jgi:hypothetical protein